MLPLYNDNKENLPLNVRKMTLSSLFAALMVVCAWIAIPTPAVAVTMQTFGILMALGTLGGKWGTVSILLYLSMGIIGLPVFSGFQGGIAALLGPTGGFLWGFLLGSLGYWAAEKTGKLPSMVLCQLICYLCGTLWFSHWAGVSLSIAVLTTVVPYLLPDALKLWLAFALSNRIRKQLKLGTIHRT